VLPTLESFALISESFTALEIFLPPDSKAHEAMPLPKYDQSLSLKFNLFFTLW